MGTEIEHGHPRSKKVGHEPPLSPFDIDHPKVESVRIGRGPTYPMGQAYGKRNRGKEPPESPDDLGGYPLRDLEGNHNGGRPVLVLKQ